MTDTNNMDGAALLPVTQADRELVERLCFGMSKKAISQAAMLIARHRISHSLPGDVGTEKLRGLSERAAPAPWVVYSEPEVGLFASVFSGTVMETGFAPVNLDDPSNVEFIVEAVNFARAALSSPLPATQEDAERSGVGSVPRPLYEALGNLVSECADQRDVYPDAATALEAITSTVNEIYACIEDGVFAALAHPAQATTSAVSGDAGETLESIIAWGDQTFGPCSQDRAIERAGEEWSEMEEDDADVPIEAADVIICLLRIPGILDAINRKMTINRGRTWDVRPDGTGYHVKAAALPSQKGAGE